MTQRNLVTAAVVITLIAAPTAISSIYFFLTKDPTFQPLAITEEALDKLQGENRLRIVTEVRWGADSTGDRRALEEALTNSFAVFRAETRFRHVRDARAQGVSVTYHVGPSEIGPYPLEQAASGVRAAATAYRVYLDRQKAERAAEELRGL